MCACLSVCMYVSGIIPYKIHGPLVKKIVGWLVGMFASFVPNPFGTHSVAHGL